MTNTYYDFTFSNFGYWYSKVVFSFVFIGSFFLLNKNLLAAIIIMTFSLAILAFHGGRKRIIVTDNVCIIHKDRLFPAFKCYKYYYYDQLNCIEYNKNFAIWKLFSPVTAHDYLTFIFKNTDKNIEEIYNKRKKVMETVDFMNKQIEQIKREKEIEKKYSSEKDG